MIQEIIIVLSTRPLDATAGTEPYTEHSPGLIDIPGAYAAFMTMLVLFIVMLIVFVAMAIECHRARSELKRMKMSQSDKKQNEQ